LEAVAIQGGQRLPLQATATITIRAVLQFHLLQRSHPL
jgi:hypothetical protein